jgi:microcystin-dependent protein
MGTPYMSEIRIMTFNFPPKGWALCNGQLISVSQNEALFALLGTTYGGDGVNTFGLPNLQGLVPVHMGTGFSLGQSGGEEAHTITAAEMPAHTHALNASPSAGNAASPSNAMFAAETAYVPAAQLTQAAASAVSSVGASQPHSNLQPYLTLNFCIALQGIFPTQN